MTCCLRHNPMPLAYLAAFVLVAGCQREEAAAQRVWLRQWFSLGETRAFEARRGCAVGLYDLVTGQVKSALAVADSVPGMHREIARRGAAALDMPGQGADMAMVAMANHHRPTGMAMRRAGLEARACMTEVTESAFRHALDETGTVLAWDETRGALILMARTAGYLVVVQGEAR
ncbi:hypothetical protein [uncultured Roseovarius sp.]|uniref:hypothetical protein n=1 Tax=uncultured Roseovarius sp. TaxID=293344 RepID=UPI002625AE8D|nr:hypothetical protein [uncultured Roseovarius sp.]